MWRIAILLIGCGRLGFDATTGGPDAVTSDASVAVRSIADDLPCNAPVLLDGGGHLAHDVLTWVNDPQGDWLVGVAHVSQDVHRLERHAITMGPSGAVAGAAGLISAVDHVDVLSFETVAGGYVLGYNEFVLQTGHAILLGPGMAELAAQPLGMLASGNPPLARAGNGGLAMVGLTSNDLQVIGLRDDGSPTGVTNHLATPAEAAGLPTMVSLDDGLAVVWHSAPRGTCRIARLRADLSIAAGPFDVAIGGCSDAHVAWLPASRRILMVADNTSNGSSSIAVWDENLLPIMAPVMLAPSAHWSRILGDGDGAWVAWAETGTVQKVRHARVDPDGHPTVISAAVGALDDSLGHYHTIQRTGQSAVVMWTDAAQSRTFSAMRLCR